MRDFLRLNTQMLYVMLGTDCNMDCKYCIQKKDERNERLPEVINPTVYRFTEQICEQTKKLRIVFFGGEPLLYFPQIKEFVENTKHLKNIHFGIVTNGKAITNEMVDYFNANDITLSVSWDGDKSVETRGYDVFAKSSPQREILFRVDTLAVLSIISSKLSVREAIEAHELLDNQYKAFHSHKYKNLWSNIEFIINGDDSYKDLSTLDLDKLRDDVNWILDDVVNKRANRFQTRFIYQFLDSVKLAVKLEAQNAENPYCCCGNGYTVLNIDLFGNLYRCHNALTKVGHINNSFFTYLAKLLTDDRKILDECNGCEIEAYCVGGCKTMPRRIKEQSLCLIKKTVFKTLLKRLVEIGGIDD